MAEPKYDPKASSSTRAVALIPIAKALIEQLRARGKGEPLDMFTGRSKLSDLADEGQAIVSALESWDIAPANKGDRATTFEALRVWNRRALGLPADRPEE